MPLVYSCLCTAALCNTLTRPVGANFQLLDIGEELFVQMPFLCAADALAGFPLCVCCQQQQQQQRRAAAAGLAVTTAELMWANLI